MTEDIRSPAIGAMAYIALFRGTQVTGRFRPRAATGAVTYIALAGRTAIMDPGAAHEGCGGVAGVAIEAGLKMRRIGLGIFTNRSHAIMT